MPNLEESNTLCDIIKSMKKPSSDRSENDLIEITRFLLLETEIANIFRNESMEEKNLERMLYSCSKFIKHKSYLKNSIIFVMGSVGEKFYIILKGSVNIMKPVEKKIKMTLLEYYNYLKYLRDKGDNYLIRKSLSVNNYLYPVEMKDIDDLDRIIFQSKMKSSFYLKPTNTINFKKVSNLLEEPTFKETDSNIKLLSICRELVKSKDEENINKLQNITESKADIVRKIVTIYKLDFFLKLKSRDHFGDYAIESNTCRTATIIADEETHVGVIDIEVYKEFILIEKQKLKAREIMFFIDNFFFFHLYTSTFFILRIPYYCFFFDCFAVKL